jgi:hypothetical protein
MALRDGNLAEHVARGQVELIGGLRFAAEVDLPGPETQAAGRHRQAPPVVDAADIVSLEQTSLRAIALDIGAVGQKHLVVRQDANGEGGQGVPLAVGRGRGDKVGQEVPRLDIDPLAFLGEEHRLVVGGQVHPIDARVGHDGALRSQRAYIPRHTLGLFGSSSSVT